jgi:hypothetical protein
LFLCSTLVGCATAPPPKVSDENISAIAISVYVDCLAFRVGSRSSGEENIRIDYVFFIRLDSMEGSLKKSELLVSNYVNESLKASLQFDAVDSFFMNIEPGIYAAVGAAGIGRTSGNNYILYFPEVMVKKSICKVQPNTITYMGKFILDRVASFEIGGHIKKQLSMQADEIQVNDPQIYYSNNHAFDLIKLNNEDTVNSKYGNPMKVLPTMYDSLCSASDEKLFLNYHIKTFAESRWILKIKNRLSMIEN